MGSKKQNGVLAVVEELVQEQAKLNRARVISIVKSQKMSPSAHFKYLYFGPILFRELYLLAKTKDVFFHLHGALNVQLNFVAAFLWLLGAPYCVSPHGAFTKRSDPMSRLKMVFIHTVVVWSLRRARFVHVFGGRDTELIKGQLKGITLFVAPNGIRRNSHTRDRDNRGDGSSKLRLGFCGRVNYREKGLDLVPDILQRLVAEKLQVSFDLIGSGPDLRHFSNEVAARGLDKYVTYHGALFGAEKFRALGEIDIFLHPSRNEGMPLAPLEALSSGARILISPETNLELYLNEIEGVFIIPTRNPEDWCSAIVEAGKTRLDVEAVNKLLTTSLKWQKIAEDFLKQYEGNTPPNGIGFAE